MPICQSWGDACVSLDVCRRGQNPKRPPECRRRKSDPHHANRHCNTDRGLSPCSHPSLTPATSSACRGLLPPPPSPHKSSNTARWLTGSGFALAICALALGALLFAQPETTQAQTGPTKLWASTTTVGSSFLGIGYRASRVLVMVPYPPMHRSGFWATHLAQRLLSKRYVLLIPYCCFSSAPPFLPVIAGCCVWANAHFLLTRATTIPKLPPRFLQPRPELG